MKTDASGFPENVRRPGIPNPAHIVSRRTQVVSVKVSKGLEFPVVAPLSVEQMPAQGGDEKGAARVFYVAPTRATQRLVMGVGGQKSFGSKWHWDKQGQPPQCFAFYNKKHGRPRPLTRLANQFRFEINKAGNKIWNQQATTFVNGSTNSQIGFKTPQSGS